MKKTTTPLAAAILALIAATVSLACNEAFAQPPMIGSAKPPIDLGLGARARAFDIQNGNIQSDTMRSLNGWIYQSQTRTYFNPSTGITCPASGAGCF